MSLPGHFALALPLLRHRIFSRHARPRRHPLERGAPRRTEPDFSYLKELNQTCSIEMNLSEVRVSGGPIYALTGDGTAFRAVAGGGHLYGCAPASRVEPLYFRTGRRVEGSRVRRAGTPRTSSPRTSSSAASRERASAIAFPCVATNIYRAVDSARVLWPANRYSDPRLQAHTHPTRGSRPSPSSRNTRC
jgi:hypothetical protein